MSSGTPQSSSDTAVAVFPAVTATVQATMRTALPPAKHGIVSSGYFDRLSCQVNLENPSAHLVQGPRVWETLRAKGGTVALLFQQHSFGERADMVLAPLPMQATRGKIVRAEPAAALYEQGTVHHVGFFQELEEELCGYRPGAPSPDRMDALVWALTELAGHNPACRIIPA